MKVRCAHCSKPVRQAASAVNRALKLGLRIFCDRRCAGLGRRVNRTKAQRVAMKADYDREYRRINRAMLKRKHAEYHQRTYDPEKARAWRKARGNYHTLYCRKRMADPAHKAAKQEYDKQRRALLAVGPEWAECWRLLWSLQKEIRSRQSGYERRVERGYYTRSAQQRRRDAQVSRW